MVLCSITVSDLFNAMSLMAGNIYPIKQTLKSGIVKIMNIFTECTKTMIKSDSTSNGSVVSNKQSTKLSDRKCNFLVICHWTHFWHWDDVIWTQASKIWNDWSNMKWWRSYNTFRFSIQNCILYTLIICAFLNKQAC